MTDAPQIPPPPRPLTPAAKKRSWHEPMVRSPLILTIVIAAITLAFTIEHVAGAMIVRRLIQSGIPVIAKVEQINGQKSRNRQFPRSETVEVQFTYTGPDGIKRSVDTNLEPLRDAAGKEPAATSLVYIDMPLPIRVDPSDNSVWTDQTVPKDWSRELAVVDVLALLTIALAGRTLLRRANVLRLWRDGTITPAAIVDSRQSGLAPWSRVVRYNLLDGSDRRVFTTVVPNRAGAPRPGETLWLLIEPRRPGLAIVPALYL